MHVGDEINWRFLTRDKKVFYIGQSHRDCKTAVSYCFSGKKKKGKCEPKIYSKVSLYIHKVKVIEVINSNAQATNSL